MDKIYKHQDIEKKWYEEWEKNGYFTPKVDKSKKPFTIILPPPNANANLHLGHAMMAVEDVMIRYHRMKGYNTLFLPGADHAGFETQYVFEKKLNKEGKSRFDFERETLYKMIWDFVHENRANMENQLRRLGFSLDWTRNIFTLDPRIVKIVYKTFKKLYDDGLVYHCERLVNYCTKCGTGFSDLEVNHLETVDKLFYIKYPLEDSSGYITVATTRPETMFGDVAIAVHPKDKKYMKLVGKKAAIPLSDRKIPIIADDMVDRKFGTGAVKITPAHDENDFNTGAKHNLPRIQVIGFNGRMKDVSEVPQRYRGLKVGVAREKVAADLASDLDQINEKHQMVKNVCYKCGTVIEPLPLPQWYVKVKPLTQKALGAIREKTISFAPKRQEKTAIRWLTDFHDWNISRQIVWGIRIPAWKCQECPEERESWVITEGESPTRCPVCGSIKLKQDTDTFDTWFSSGQWPFATLLANSGKDLEYFYPTSVMETGYDILPWWVCRMMMLGIYKTGKIPFHTVCLHGLIRDAKGQKMSKSKGNVINPLDMVEKYGADALRFALLYGTAFGNDVPMSEDKIRGMRNFSNKLWNIGRFILMNREFIEKTGVKTAKDISLPQLIGNGDDKNIIRGLEKLIIRTSEDMESYKFDQAANGLYEFIWHVFADKYIEVSKDRLRNNDLTVLLILRYVYFTCLKLLHPFMPFITEEIARQMGNEKSLIVSGWPKV